MHEDLAVPLASGDARGDHAHDAEALRDESLRHRDDGLRSGRGIADDPARADRVAPGLELRLHERDDVPAVAQVRKRRREREAQRDERDIGDDEVDALRELEALPHVHALARDHPWVLAQRPVELAAADVHRMDAQRAALQERVGEAAGRGADIERDASANVDAQIVERARELGAAARYVARASLDADGDVVGDERRRTVRRLTFDAHGAGHDERLRALAARSERARHQELVEAAPSARAGGHAGGHRTNHEGAAPPTPYARYMARRLPRARTLKGDPKLAYYDSGGGVAGEAPIVLLHGATLGAVDWENIFPRLATRYRVIAYDARGHGRSGRAEGYALDGFVADTLRMLREVARAPAIVVGHSLGGATALVAAAREPDAVRALVLEEPWLARYRDGWRAEYFAALHGALGAFGDASAFSKALSRIALPEPGPRGERTLGEVRGFYALERMSSVYGAVDPAFVTLLGTADRDGSRAIADAVSTVRAPLLLLAADQKSSALAEGEAERITATAPDRTLVRFPGVGHRIHGVRPEPFLEALEPFLRRVRS